MEFIDAKLAAYVEAHCSEETELLKKINRSTHLKVMMPRMLSGHLQGQVLSMLSHLLQPKNILEIGTYTGYSAICLAQGLAKNGKLITLDINAELEDMVRQFIEEAGLEKSIDYRIGNALDLIPQLKEEFDLVFIDADKNNYATYYDLVFDKLRKGGIIVADNVLWSGKILLPNSEMDKDTAMLDAFNKKVHADARVENVLLPIRDGLMVIRKL